MRSRLLKGGTRSAHSHQSGTLRIGSADAVVPHVEAQSMDSPRFRLAAACLRRPRRREAGGLGSATDRRSKL